MYLALNTNHTQIKSQAYRIPLSKIKNSPSNKMNLKFSRSTKPPKILEFSKLSLFSPPQDCWIFVSGRGTLSDCQPHSRDPAIYALVAITGATLIMLFFYLFGSGKLLIPLHDILKL